jgi:hypothetical protein
MNPSAGARSLKGDSQQAADFLDRMVGENKPRHLVAIPTEGALTARSFAPSERAAMVNWIDAQEGIANVYYTVNELKPGVKNRKARKSDVDHAVQLHVDIDDVGALERLRKFSPKPTVVVFSGGGFQAFWTLSHSTTALADVERINADIAQKLGGDNCHNIDRIMRLPGTINLPNAKKRAAGRVPTRAYVVEEATEWSRRYSLDDFEKNTSAEPAEPVLPSAVQVVSLNELPSKVPAMVRSLIELGDDKDRPIGSNDPRFPSRSEAVWRCACELARAGCTIREIAGVLSNPGYGISASILEKKNPAIYALRQASRAVEAVGEGWPDVNRQGRPRATLNNTIVAMRRMGLRFTNDQFRHRKKVEGQQIQEYQGDLSDDACSVLRYSIMEECGFDPGKENSREAAQTLCVENPFHPIRQYLDGLCWDGMPRLDRWMVTYLGAENTPLNVAMGRIVLIAAVRRVRHPGTKFDNVLVLEGAQGGGKSTAIKILAGDENFSDQDILTQDPKTQMEGLEGVWLYEISELEGLSRADTSKVKAFASRATDRGRPAYARFRESRPRQTVFIGTTNDDKYLRDMTGNRRFWPVRIGKIELEALERDRDQLWAEASDWEEKGESLILSEELWPLAQIEQEARLEDDPWLDILSELRPENLDQVGEMVRVATAWLLEVNLQILPDRQQQFQTKRLASLMRKLGWKGPAPIKMKDGRTVRGYERPTADWGDSIEPGRTLFSPKY